MKVFLPRNANPSRCFFKRYGSEIRPHRFEASCNGFECTPSSMWTACLWRRGCRAVSGEENVKGLEIQNILGYRHHLKFDVCLVVTGGLAVSYTGYV
jgi:hypothetical protein